MYRLLVTTLHGQQVVVARLSIVSSWAAQCCDSDLSSISPHHWLSAILLQHLGSSLLDAPVQYTTKKDCWYMVGLRSQYTGISQSSTLRFTKAVQIGDLRHSSNNFVALSCGEEVITPGLGQQLSIILMSGDR